MKMRTHEAAKATSTPTSAIPPQQSGLLPLWESEEGDRSLLSSESWQRSPSSPTPIDPSSVGHRFGAMAIGSPSTPMLQRKLAIGQPNDHYEQEADLVADQVMRMPAPKIQRVCPECKEELKRQPIEEEEKTDEETLQTKPLAESITPLIQRQMEPLTCADRGLSSSGRVPQIIERQMRSPGQPLDTNTAAFFGSRFGFDFSRVRVHTDDEAAKSARELSAAAFTVGQNIVFGAGRFDRDSVEGKRLIGHELAHVVQQSRPASAVVSPSEVGDLESHADQATDKALSVNAPVNVQGSAQGGVQLNAEVYVWDPHVDGYGHAAIKLSNGSYISWWPAGRGTTKQQYWTGRPGGGHSYDDDIGPDGEGKGPDHTYDLGTNCLDEAAMWKWYNTNFAGASDPKWSVLRNSCSDVAHQAINAGSSLTNPCYLSVSHSNLFWTPKDLGAYAECQSRWCQSKAKGTLNAAGRYIWENVKEVAGGAAVNTLKSLWWKGEIITH